MQNDQSHEVQDNNEKNCENENAESYVTTPSTKRGRFFIENAKTETFSSIKKGRFNIYHPEVSIEYKLIFEIIEKQNEQIETIFDMVNNLSGEDKLFHKEFLTTSGAVYQRIERLRHLLSKFGSG